MKEMSIVAVVSIKASAGAYCSDKEVVFQFPATHHVLARSTGHDKFFVVAPRDTFEDPIPQWMPTLIELGDHSKNDMPWGTIVMESITPLELTSSLTCKTGKFGPLWTQTDLDKRPKMCIARRGRFGWEYEWSVGVMTDLNPELTSFEQGVNTLLSLEEEAAAAELAAGVPAQRPSSARMVRAPHIVD